MFSDREYFILWLFDCCFWLDYTSFAGLTNKFRACSLYKNSWDDFLFTSFECLNIYMLHQRIYHTSSTLSNWIPSSKNTHRKRRYKCFCFFFSCSSITVIQLLLVVSSISRENPAGYIIHNHHVITYQTKCRLFIDNHIH